MKARVDDAQTAAMRQYAKAHDRFAELEQIELGRKHPFIAEGARWHSRMIARAWLAERDDPEPT